MSSTKPIPALLASVSAVVLMTQPSLAQNTGPGDEIIVTATRQSQALSKVPISVTAFAQEKMDQLSVRDFTQIAAVTPGVRITEGSNNIAVRGVASNAGAATTGVYIDETPIQVRTFGSGAAAGLPAIFDLERVEVLRGPQGTLFGAGAQGGVVRYITPQPSLDRYSVYSRAQVAFTQSAEPSYEAGAAVGGPIVADKLGFRVSAWNQREGGWVDRVDYRNGRVIDKNANWSNITVLRGALAFQPVEGLVVTPSILFQKRFRNDANTFWEGISDRGEHRFLNGSPQQLFNRDRYLLPALKVDYDFGGVSLVSNTSYFKRVQRTFYDGSIHRLAQVSNFAGVPPLLSATGPRWAVYGIDNFLSSGDVDNRQHNFAQEIRLQSTDPDAAVTWVVGGFYGKSKQRNIETLYEPDINQLYQNVLGRTFDQYYNTTLDAAGMTYRGNQEQVEEQLAGFADVSVRVAEGLRLNAGVRIAQTKFAYDSENFSAFAADAGARLTGGRSKETPITPKFSINYQANPELLLYASAAKGYRVGGANAPLPPTCGPALESLGISIPPGAYKSDNVWSYEVGSKGRLFDGALRYEASAYYLKWSGIQQSTYLALCGLSYTDNLGKADSKGFDLQGQARLFEGFNLDFAVGYTKARYTQNQYASPLPGASILVEKGDGLPGISPWTFMVAGVQNFDVSGYDAYIRVAYEYSSRNLDTPVQNSATSQYDANLPVRPATHFVRVRAGVDVNQVNLSLFVDNLFDTSPRLTRAHNTRTTPLYTVTTFRPRTAGITATYRY